MTYGLWLMVNESWLIVELRFKVLGLAKRQSRAKDEWEDKGDC